MEEEDSFSDQIQFDDDYQPFSLGEDDYQNQKFIGEKQFKNLNLSEKVKQYFLNYKKYEKCSKKDFMKFFSFKSEVEELKSVCAKPIERGETIAQCYDCAADNSCIQCMECFKNSNHEGHKVIIKKAYGGCCDCGDIEAWKKEGFCNKHTGQAIDLEIDPKQQENFLNQMRQLFFLLFWDSLQQNSNFTRGFSNQLLQNLSYMNEKGVYYNKLTTLVFDSKLPEDLVVSKNVNKRTILANLLSPQIAKNLKMDDWMDLFFSMFQYYPFKKLLLSTYIRNFSMIYNDDENSSSRGTSISCQLLTSYQLVREYVLGKENLPIGADIDITRIRSFDTLYYVLLHDLNYITKLQEDTPKTYFTFHFKNKDCILKLFEYRKVIKNEQDKHLDEPPILQLARFVKYFQIQYKLMELLAKVARILQKDKQTLAFVIKTLYEQALKQQNERKMIIFQPLTRALTIFLFSFFDLDLRKLNPENLSDLPKKIKDLLCVNEEEFSKNLTKLFKVYVETYLFHSKILSEPGLNTTLYAYIHFYKLKNRFISSLDMLGIKMMVMMHSWSQFSKQPIISPQDFIWEGINSKTLDAKRVETQGKIKNLQFMLSQLNLIAVSQNNELYVAYQIDGECNMYKDYIEMVLIKILNQQKGALSMTSVKEYEQAFFHPKVDISQNYLKRLCTYDKSKKAFLLRKQYEQNEREPVDSLNYSDFRCNLTNKGDFQSPERTLTLIRESKNQQIYDSLYEIQTIKKFIVKAIEYVQILASLKSQKEDQNYNLNVDKLKPLFSQIFKMVFIKRHVSKQTKQLDVVFEFLRKIEQIGVLANPFYHQMLYEQKIEEEKSDQTQKQERQSPQKQPNLVLKSSQEDRKKKLKEKMEKKKKSIKQRYTKQLAKFEQEQKQKLQQEELIEQVEHKLNCIICKSQEQENLIYLVRVTYKNHQKLLRLGEGVTCISIQSCYHSIDYDCYCKLEAEVGNRKKPLIKCPFCKFSTNTFLPIKASSKHVPDALKKFQVSLFMEKNLEEISILEEIVKSFYHFSLLAYLDPQRTLHRRLKIYKVLFEILKENVKLYDFKKVYDKFVNKTMNLNPIVRDQQKGIKRSEQLLDLQILLQNNEDSISLQDLSDNQIQNFLNLMAQNQQANEQQQPSMIFRALNSLREKVIPNKKKSEEQNKKPKNKMTKIFKQTLRRLFRQLQLKQFQPIQSEEKEQCTQKVQVMEVQQFKQKEGKMEGSSEQIFEEDISAQIQVCLKRLFEQNTTHHLNSIYEDLNENNSALKIRDLPLNFKPLSKLNKCDCCKEITSSITLCLLCNWQGCLKNCLSPGYKQKSKDKLQNGGTFNHSKVHGEQSLFLIMESCNVANISIEGNFTSLGCIYKDEWGNDFDRKQAWQNFFLDEGELNKFKISFLHDQ